MRLRFLCIDPGTNGGNCPAMWLDEETGDLLVQGEAITDSGTLAQAAPDSPMGARESMVRVPARMRTVIMEALRATGDDTRAELR